MLILSNIERHVRLNEEERELFLSVLQPFDVKRKELLVRSGEICRYDYFVNSGCLKVCYINDKGQEAIIKFAIENWWVVDLDSFIKIKPSFYYIEAVENTRVLAISRSNYDKVHRTIPAFEKFSKIRWQEGFIALQHRIIQSLSQTAEERFSQFQAKYPGLDQRISQKLIAAYLGVTPEFLSVLRKKWATSFS